MFGCRRFGVYVFGQGRKGTVFQENPHPNLCRKIKNPRGVPTLVPFVLAHSRIVLNFRTERPPENALSIRREMEG